MGGMAQKKGLRKGPESNTWDVWLKELPARLSVLGVMSK